jgi:hypothetical protein
MRPGVKRNFFRALAEEADGLIDLVVADEPAQFEDQIPVGVGRVGGHGGWITVFALKSGIRFRAT